MKRVFPFVSLLLLYGTQSVFAAAIEQIWLTYPRNEPTHLMVHWETETAAESVVHFGPTATLGRIARAGEKTRLHKVEIPFDSRAPQLFYSVQSGSDRSGTNQVKTYTADTLRIGVVADWQGKPDLSALTRDDIHLLLTAGDNIADLHSACGAGIKDCWKPYSRLVASYPELFATVPIMPALGNHDREIRPRGPRPPEEPVYDIEATAFRAFFSLPDDGWKWRLDLPAFGLRLVALDLNHTSDMGTTWQTCHPFDSESEQLNWYRKQMADQEQPFVITLQNERNSAMRRAANGEWGRLFERGSAVITGFGYFAERAEVNGFPYFNTSLGAGDKYPDPNSEFIAVVGNYLLLEFRREHGAAANIAIKDLTGKVLDQRKISPGQR